MCSVDEPETPEQPDDAAEAADIYLGEQDSAEATATQNLGLRRFQTMYQPSTKGSTGLKIV